MKKAKTLVIAHRVCPALAKTAVGFYTKEDMVKASTASLAAAIREYDGDVRLVVILDGCPDWREFFEGILSGVPHLDLSFVETPSIGNHATYARQLEILSDEHDADYLYFSEDDYLYKPEALTAMAAFLDEENVHFVTPLDHPDRYSGIVPQGKKSEIRVSCHCHWREIGMTCCTFMVKNETFHKALGLLAAYANGSSDGAMWLGLTKNGVFNPSATFGAALRFVTGRRITREGIEFTALAAWKWHKWQLLLGHRYRLWSPMPSLCVHLCEPSLPPFWEKIAGQTIHLKAGK